MDEEIISLTAQIVSSHIANNEVLAAELPAFIREVHRALVTAGQTPAERNKAEPSVAVKKSVFADHIVCLDCGRGFKILKRHISTDHQMTPFEYRNKWNLPSSYPMVAADYAASRSKFAKESGLGRKAAVMPSPRNAAVPRDVHRRLGR